MVLAEGFQRELHSGGPRTPLSLLHIIDGGNPPPSALWSCKASAWLDVWTAIKTGEVVVVGQVWGGSERGAICGEPAQNGAVQCSTRNILPPWTPGVSVWGSDPSSPV